MNDLSAKALSVPSRQRHTATHSFSDNYSYDGTHHWRECTDAECDEVSEKTPHRGGTATYTERAVCEVCAQPYGDLAVNTTPLGGTITVGSNTWDSASDEITFDLFFKESQTVTITAADTGISVKKIEYCLSDKKLDNITQAVWTEYTESFDITQENEYVIYARITDKEDNSVIINSNGFVLDKTAPVIQGIENGKTYCIKAVFTVQDKYYCQVYVDGTILYPRNNEYKVKIRGKLINITVTDKAGNSVSYTINISVNHKWSVKVEKVDNESHAIVCTNCNEILPGSTQPHSFNLLYYIKTCSDCGYTKSEDDNIVTVYNNSSLSTHKMSLLGVGLAKTNY